MCCFTWFLFIIVKTLFSSTDRRNILFGLLKTLPVCFLKFRLLWGISFSKSVVSEKFQPADVTFVIWFECSTRFVSQCSTCLPSLPVVLQKWTKLLGCTLYMLNYKQTQSDWAAYKYQVCLWMQFWTSSEPFQDYRHAQFKKRVLAVQKILDF